MDVNEELVRLAIGTLFAIVTAVVIWFLQRKLLPRLDELLHTVQTVSGDLAAMAQSNSAEHLSIQKRQDETNGRLLKQEGLSAAQGEQIARLDERTATMLQVERRHSGIMNGEDK